MNVILQEQITICSYVSSNIRDMFTYPPILVNDVGTLLGIF